jgi:hypothetical protein
MSRAIVVNNSQLFAAATAIAATAGFLTAAPPAQADPTKCTQYGFNGLFNIRGDNGWTVDFNSTGPTAGGAATVHFYDGGNVNGNVSRGGIQGNTIDFAIQWNDKPNNVWNFHGTVSDDGLVHDGGEALGSIPSDYSGEVTSGWHSTTPLKCMDAPPPAPPPPPPEQSSPPPSTAAQEPEPAPKQGPLVSAEPGLTGVTFHITDRSGVASQCTYSSEGFESSFALPANGSFDLFVPAVRLFKTRTGTVTCDNGTSTNTSVVY